MAVSKHIKTKTFAKWFTAAVLILLNIGGCEEKRAHRLEIIGAANWFNSSRADTAYLFNKFKSNFQGKLEWPPQELSRVIDISMDLSYSMYMGRVIYNDLSITIAEFNAFMLKDFLHEILKPGDLVRARILGKNRLSGEIASKEYVEFRIPPDTLLIDARILYRKYNDLVITVKSQVKNDKLAFNYHEIIHGWFSSEVKKAGTGSGKWMQSPLLEQMASVIDQYEDHNLHELIVVFVTDGWIEDDVSIRFWPRYYSQFSNVIEKMKEIIDKPGMKPNALLSADTQIILLGLRDEGNRGYRYAQKEIFKYFFNGQKVEFKYY